MSDTNNLLNITTINELKEILEEGISEIYLEFHEDMLQLLTDIKLAAADNNNDAVIRVAHTIKGAAGNIGLQKISVIAGKIESDLRLEKTIDITLLIKDIDRAFTETQAALISMELLPA